MWKKRLEEGLPEVTMERERPVLLDSLLREIDRTDRLEKPSARVDDFVMARWAQAREAPATDVSHAWTNRRVWRVAAAIAVATMAAYWSWGGTRGRRPAAARQATEARAAIAAARAPEPQVATAAPPETDLPTGPNSVAPRRRARSRRVASSVTSPVASAGTRHTERDEQRREPAGFASRDTPFVALPTPFDGESGPMRVMRVRMGYGAARALGVGVPIHVMREGPVQADVILGADGVARAIRFVPSDTAEPLLGGQ